MDKDAIIERIYYDLGQHGSMRKTYLAAKRRNQYIQEADVKDWFYRNIQRKKNLAGYNSFVTNERLYDTNMLRETLSVSPSYLKRQILKFEFDQTDFVKYKNLYLYRESSVIKFINSIVECRVDKDLNYLKRKLEKHN